MNEELKSFSREELLEYIEVLSKNWLAIDGTWFQAVEREFGLENAIKCDKESWNIFSVVEAKRLMQVFNIPENGGIQALIKALKLRVYANINVQELVDVSDDRCVFRMNKCRVQSARNQKGLPDFPCKEVGKIEYKRFAQVIDPRIEVTCICCPPDDHPNEYYCAWEFQLKDKFKN